MKRTKEHTVSLPDLRQFLRQQGWKRSLSEDRNWEIYTLQLPGMEDEARILLPHGMKRGNGQYERRAQIGIESATRTLSGLFERDAEEITALIQGRDRDVMSVHLPVVSKAGSVSLQEATKQLEQIKSLVAYATAALEDPRPHYATWKGRMLAMTNHFQFGHTFDGSFGLTIESPITHKPETLQSLFADDAIPDVQVNPFAHRVMERIARSLVQISRAANDGGAERIVEGYREGANANMCESIAQSLKRASGSITYAFQWSPQVEVADELAEQDAIRLTSRHIPLLERASSQMREREPEETEVVGRVIQLASREPSRLGSQKSVRVEVTDRSPGEPESVVVELGVEAYKEAIRAHENEEYVRVRGSLVRSGNYWHLADPHDFQKWEPRRGL